MLDLDSYNIIFSMIYMKVMQQVNAAILLPFDIPQLNKISHRIPDSSEILRK